MLAAGPFSSAEKVETFCRVKTAGPDAQTLDGSRGVYVSFLLRPSPRALARSLTVGFFRRLTARDFKRKIRSDNSKIEATHIEGQLMTRKEI